MILIADSGATKTNWRLVDTQKNVYSYSTQGINPYFQTKDDITKLIASELVPQITIPLKDLNIFFYGAGCGSDTNNAILVNALQQSFINSNVEVQNDLLAAARALCADKKGLVAILGTGSNTCFYDGYKITKQIGGLGFIIGDEGSGAHLGKTFIQAYFNNELPKHIADKFYSQFKLEKQDILDAIYKKPLPSRFFASFAKFVHENLNEDSISNITLKCFEQFIEKNICKYPNYIEYNLNCVGSVAFYFKDFLTKAAEAKGIKVGKIIKDPIQDLTEYHLNQLK